MGERKFLSAGKSGLSPIFVRAAPFGAFIAFLAAQSLPGLSPLAREWLVIDRALVVGVLLAFLWPSYTELRGGPALTRRDVALSFAAGIAVFAAWIALDTGWARWGERSAGFRPVDEDGSIQWSLAALRLIGLAGVVPLMEEIFWRSFLMRWLDRRDFLSLPARDVSRIALCLSAGLFAMEHSLWVAGLIAGLAYAGLYIRTNNLWAPILAHTVTNATLGFWILATGSWHLW